MAEIPATMVVKLRKITGQGMMDCKKALQEANGDIDQAVEILRKKGLATLTKRGERETSEGMVILAEGSNWVSLATLCCETDFVARSDDFVAAVDFIRNHMDKCKAEDDADSLLETAVNGKKLSEIVTETAGKTGEKMMVGDYARFYLSGPGLIGRYLHFNGKVGAMVEIQTNDQSVAQTDVMQNIASDIAMHITAVKPRWLNRERIEPEEIQREKAIYAEQVKDKPSNIIDKIVEGKMNKFYTENCLLEQLFVKDDSKTVAQVLAEAAQQAGGQAKIKRFVRFEVG